MKNLITFLLILIASSLSPSVCYAGNITFPIVKQPVTDEPIIKEDDDDFKHLPSRPIACTISSEGVVIAGVEEEILSFEINYPDNGGCILSTTDEQEFINALFSLPADFYQVVFTTDDYRYIGYIEIY